MASFLANNFLLAIFTITVIASLAYHAPVATAAATGTSKLGLPTIPGTPSITIPGTPSITIPGLPNTTIPGLPNITIPISVLPNITIPGLPNITIPSETININATLAGIQVVLNLTTTNGISVSGSVKVLSLNGTVILFVPIPALLISGLPNVPIPSLPNVTIPGLPTVPIPSLPNITIPGLPNVTIPSETISVNVTLGGLQVQLSLSTIGGIIVSGLLNLFGLNGTVILSTPLVFLG